MPEDQCNTSLALSQNRWVLAAAIQDRALRDAAASRPFTFGALTNNVLAYAYPLTLLVLALLVVHNLCNNLKRLVYPITKQPPTENPFMDGAGAPAYGAVLSKDVVGRL